MKCIKFSTLETIKDIVVSLFALIILLWIISLPLSVAIGIFFEGTHKYIDIFIDFSLWIMLWALIAVIAMYILLPVIAIFYPLYAVIIKPLGLVLFDTFVLDDRENSSIL